MTSIDIASKRFTMRDQEAFAALSGDYNPMHLDPVAARRTQAGEPTVHGVQAMLWALDALARDALGMRELVLLNVRFGRFVAVGRTATLRLLTRTDDAASACLIVDDMKVAVFWMRFGRRESSNALLTLASGAANPTDISRVSAPSINEMKDLAGWVAPRPGQSARSLFPHLCDALGDDRLVAIALLSSIVGMVCPGLHSIFGELQLTLADTPEHPPGIGFGVTGVDERFNLVRMRVGGNGLFGSISSLVRPPPVATPAIATLAAHVRQREFAGASALVTGASRGLGAMTAKLLAAGGADVVVTYATGRDDADNLAAEINAFAGSERCRVIRYDATVDAPVQLAALTQQISHFYHFASPRILRHKGGLFDPVLFAEFAQVYVMAFESICRFLRERQSNRPMAAFYPSTVYIESGRPRNMAEYVMAKAAGEVMCSEINAVAGGIRVIVSRLPRVLTDQTASTIPLSSADPLEVMLPVIREVQSAASTAGESPAPTASAGHGAHRQIVGQRHRAITGAGAPAAFPHEIPG